MFLILRSTYLVGMDQHHEGVPFAAHILLTLQKVGDQLGRIRDEKVKVLKNGEDGKNCISPDVRVTVLKTGSDGRHQRFQQLGLFQFTEESQC